MGLKSNATHTYNTGRWRDANNFVTQDGADTPVTSPVSVTAVATTTLQVPEQAVEIMIYSNQALRVSEDSTLASYYVLGANGVVVLNVADMEYVYLRGNAVTCTVSFVFSKI